MGKRKQTKICMRDIYQELRSISMTHDTCSEVINLIASLTIDELQSCGNNNVYHPPGYEGESFGTYGNVFVPTTDEEVEHLFNTTIYNRNQFFFALRNQLKLNLGEAKEYLDKYFPK